MVHRTVSNRHAACRRAHQRTRGIAAVTLIAGGAAAVVCGVIWAALVVLTGYEVGYVAWGIGFAVGLAVAATAKDANPGYGVSAAGLAVAGLLVGKLLIFQWGAVPEITRQLPNEPDLLFDVVMLDLMSNGKLDADLQQQIEAIPEGQQLPEELSDKIVQAAEADIAQTAQMSDEQKQVRNRELAELLVANIGYSERIQSQLSLWDLLWFGLAVFTAYKLAASSKEGEGEPQVASEETLESDQPPDTDPDSR